MPYYERKSIPFEQSERFDIAKAYERAQKALNADRIDPKKFIDRDIQTVNRDMQYVRDREGEFKLESRREAEEDRKMATILEAIIHEHVELSDWLGPRAETITTSRYDDIANGVDSIVRFGGENGNEGDTHLGLAIDVTFSTDIRDKLNAILNDAEKGRLTQIKYFALPDPEDPDTYIHTGSLNVPRVVIGMERETVQQLALLWMDKKNKELAAHPAQYLITREILDQLAVFDRYARMRGNPNNIGGVYRNVSKMIEESLKEKEGDTDYSQGMKPLKNDRVFGNIQAYLDDVLDAMK